MISFVIPHYQDGDRLSKLLASIAQELQTVASPAGETFEVIVVDDASEDPLFLPQSVAFLRNENNLGPAFSRNRGARHARNAWIWFLDSDVTLLPGALSALARLLDSGGAPFDGVVSGVGVSCDSSDSFIRYKNYLEASWRPAEGSTRTVDSKSFLVRRDSFLAVGGFDEKRLDAGVEDYEFGFRFLKAGYRLYFSRAVQITHAHAGFLRQARLFYRRSRDWVGLKKEFGAVFDDNGSTAAEAVSQILGGSIVLALIGGAFRIEAVAVAAPLMVAWGALSRAKIKLARSAGEPLSFLALYMLYSWSD